MNEELPLEGTFTDLAEADMSPPVWVIKGVLPTGITFLGGPPKTMKSTIEMAFSLAVAGVRAEVLPDELTELGGRSGRVMGLSAEASAGELRHMVEVGFGVVLPHDRSIVIADDPWSFRLDDPDALATLLGWLNARKPKLFWLDPLRDFHSLEENDSGGMNRLLRPLQKWAKENHSAFLVVHHTRKKSGEDKGDYHATEMRGTTALFGIADGVIMITPRPGGKLHLRGTYKRGPEWERTVTLKAWGSSGETPKKAMDEAIEAIRIDERKVLEQLYKGKPVQKLAGADGMSREMLKASCSRLKLMGLVDLREGKLCLTNAGLDIAATLGGAK